MQLNPSVFFLLPVLDKISSSIVPCIHCIDIILYVQKNNHFVQPQLTNAGGTIIFLDTARAVYELVFAGAVKLKLTVLLLVAVQETLTYSVELVSVPVH